ncbi:MAG: ABC transporter permease [Candidatus Micrarchaeota archaeon]
MIPLAFKELKSTFGDTRFLGTILMSFLITLFITGVLIDSVGSFAQGNLLSSMPVSNKLTKIAVVERGYHQSIEELENIHTAYTIKTDLRTAQRMLASGEVHAIYIVNETEGIFIGSDRPISVMAELSVKEAVDKVVRMDKGSKYAFGDDLGIEDLVKGLLTPILLFSPIFLWSLPIIQSIAYDRENKVLEVLFSTPIDRKRILLSKVVSNMLFVVVVGAVWVTIVYFSGFTFHNPIGVFVVLLSVAFLMISMNALVSSISRSVQEATLASSISSTVIFTMLFLITMLKVFPYTAFLADVSPATYIATQVSEDSMFPLFPTLTLLIIGISALILALSAFSTEAFAFSIKPGIKQLYEGMIDILGKGNRAAIGMGLVAFSLTTPVQLLVFALVIFTLGTRIVILLMALAMVEEVLKAIGVYVMKPRSLRQGIITGAIIGISFGIGESLLLVPVFGMATVFRLSAIGVHAVCTSVSGAGYWAKCFWPSVLLASVLHAGYNYYLVTSLMG